MNKLDKIIIKLDYPQAYKYRLDNNYSNITVIQSNTIVSEFHKEFKQIEDSIEKVDYSDFIKNRLDEYKDKAIIIDMSEIRFDRSHYTFKDFNIKLRTVRMLNIRLFLIHPSSSMWNIPIEILDYVDFTVDSEIQVYYKVYTNDMDQYEFLPLYNPSKSHLKKLEEKTEPKNYRMAITCLNCMESKLKGSGIKNSGLWCNIFSQWVNHHRVCDKHV